LFVFFRFVLLYSRNRRSDVPGLLVDQQITLPTSRPHVFRLSRLLLADRFPLNGNSGLLPIFDILTPLDRNHDRLTIRILATSNCSLNFPVEELVVRKTTDHEVAFLAPRPVLIFLLLHVDVADVADVDARKTRLLRARASQRCRGPAACVAGRPGTRAQLN